MRFLSFIAEARASLSVAPLDLTGPELGNWTGFEILNFLASVKAATRPALGLQYTMLDAFEIINTSGVVLWSRSYAPVSPSVVNNFISDVFIEEKSTVAGAKDGGSAASNPPYKHDQHSLRWTFNKELGIIFVVSHGLTTGYSWFAIRR